MLDCAASWKLRPPVHSASDIESHVWLASPAPLSPRTPLGNFRQCAFAAADAGALEMGRKLYVGNIPYETSEDDLQTLFAQAGGVESVNVMRDRETGRARGFAFVDMKSDQD